MCKGVNKIYTNLSFYLEETKIEKTRGTIPKKPKVLKNIVIQENRPILPIGSKILYEKQEKLIAKNDLVAEKMQASLSMIEKIMEGANKMMEKMVRVSEVNLEEQRIKLRCLEVNKNNTQSLENLKESHVQKLRELELKK